MVDEVVQPIAMIHLTRLNNSTFLLNSDLIEHVQVTPDTLITLTNGHNYMVLERPDEIVRQIVQFRRSCAAWSPESIGVGRG